MKNKAPLSLMEQIIMLLVFALAAALCLQMFVLSGKMSRHIEAKEHAVTAVQNTAETVKLCLGDEDEYSNVLSGVKTENGAVVYYSEDWQKTDENNAEYTVCIEEEQTKSALLGRAKITAQSENGTELFSVHVSWQEESHG